MAAVSGHTAMREGCPFAAGWIRPEFRQFHDSHISRQRGGVPSGGSPFSHAGQGSLGGRGSILCCALLLCCLCLWPAGARALSSDAARACVVEAGGAVDNADAACFEQLVDMDAILNEAVDLFMKEAAKPENSSLLPPMLALMFSGAAMAEDNGLGVRKLLVSEARAFVHNGIASGAFAGKSVQDYRTEGWVAPLFESVSMGRKEIRNVGTPVRQGKDWIVPFVLRDHGNGNSYAVRARVSDAGGNPRVVAVENLRQLFVILGKEAQALES